MEERHSKPSGIKEIAKPLGIAIATVDRALRARPGASPKTRANVLKMAQQLNYKPNATAASLKLNRCLRFGVYLPREIRSLFDPLRAGVRSAADAMLGATGATISRKGYDLRRFPEAYCNFAADRNLLSKMKL